MKKRIVALVLFIALITQILPAIAQGSGIKYAIDVSEWNGIIDWDKLQKSGEIDFVIIRCGYGRDFVEQDDAMWYRNADECTKRKIPFGVYLYSYAYNEEMARSEAEHVLRLVKGYKLSYPIYYDIEDKIQKEMTPEELGAMAKAFCDVIQGAGYEVGVYASQNWWEKRLTDPVFENWDRWVACWLEQCTYEGQYNMLQYTDSGSVPGIEGRVDMNRWFDTPINNTPQLPSRGGPRPLPEDYNTESETEDSEEEPVVEPLEDTPPAENSEEKTPMKSYVKGYPDGTFKPDGNITRAEAATIIANVLEDKKSDDAVLDKFDDIDKNHWAKDSLAFVIDNGYMKGDEKGQFNPDNPITRAEFVQLLANLNILEDKSSNSSMYIDVNDHWAASAISSMSRYGIVNGYPNQTFEPSNSVTRAESVTMLSKLFKWSGGTADYKRFVDVSAEHWAFTFIMNAVGDE